MGDGVTSSEDLPSEAQLPIAIATVIQVQAPTSARPGDKALVSATGMLEGWVGGGCVQPAVIKLSRTVLETGQPCLLRVSPDGQWKAIEGLSDYASSCLGQGSVLLFVEPVHTQPTLCILGESAVARSLAEQAVNMNLNVILQAPDADVTRISERVDIRQQYEFVEADYFVVSTQGKRDIQAIKTALHSDSSHISMVVSQKKLTALKMILKEQGVTDDQLDRLTGPAGIRIGAQLPQEIALSVLAEIIQHRRQHDSASSRVESNVSSTPAQSVPAPDSMKPDGGCCGG